MQRTKVIAPIILCLIAGACATQPAGDVADTVYTNGKIYTVNEAQPWAESVAVKGNEIVYVGDNAGAEAFVSEGVRSLPFY